MRSVIVFNQVSLDGFFSDADGDMRWAHRDDPEWSAFAADNATSAGSLLLFGRVTYDLMASYWPTPMAREQAPAIADGINATPKIVFSRTLARADWANTTVVRDDPATEVRRLKQTPGKPIAVMGSGTIVSQLADAGLVDEFHLAVNPIVLGRGRSMFATLERRFELRRISTREFGNGNVLMCYAPRG